MRMMRPERIDRTGGGDPGGLPPTGPACYEVHHRSLSVARETSDMTYLVSITTRWAWLLFIVFVGPSNTGTFAASVVF